MLDIRKNNKYQLIENLGDSTKIVDYQSIVELLSQRDALESRFDLIETKMQQINATVNIYRALSFVRTGHVSR